MRAAPVMIGGKNADACAQARFPAPKGASQRSGDGGKEEKRLNLWEMAGLVAEV
jgi:hypothetical protein